MTRADTRRPWPALVALLALLLLAGLVWWRVLNRSKSAEAAKPCPSPTATRQVTILPATSSLTLQILNATNRKGIAGRARAAMSAAGFLVPAPAGNDPRNLNKIRNVGQIRYGPAQAKGATLVQLYLPGSSLVRTTSRSGTIVVSLGRRYTTLASRTAVAAALTRMDAVAGTPTPTAGASASC